MALKVAISHKTIYRYDRSVNLSPYIFRLRPAPHSKTPIEAYSIKIKPENHFFNWQQDPFGNYKPRVVFSDETEELSVDIEIIADLKTINPFDFFVEEVAEYYPFTYKETLTTYLGCLKERVTPVYEDTFYFLWEQGNLPLDVDPSNMDLKDTSVKSKIDEVLNQNSKEPVEFILPLEHYGDKWLSTTKEQKELVVGKFFEYLELEVNKEYPHTLDLRKKVNT